MIFRAPKEKIEKCIAITESIIPGKPQMQILTNIVLETEGDKINVTSTDLEVIIRTSFEASIEKEGSITLNGSKFLGIVRQLPEEDIYFEVDTDNNEIRIRSDNSSIKAKFTLKGIPKENFPPISTNIPEKSFFTFPQQTLKQMIKKTIFSISSEESRRYLNGVFFERKKDILKLISTDGRRLAYIERKVSIDKDFELASIVPHKVLNEIVKYLNEEGMIDIRFTENQVSFDFNNMIFISSLIDGNFPNYNQVIPKKQEKYATINSKSFLEALNRSSLYIEEKFSQIKLDFYENHLVMSINNSDLGSFREELAIEYNAESIEIAFNHKYMKDFFKELSTESFKIEMNTPISPVSVKSTDDEDYLYIVMPMKVPR